MSDPIADLRTAGKLPAALHLAREAIAKSVRTAEFERARNVWALHIGGENCLVLAALAACESSARQALIDALRKDSALQATAGQVWPLLVARLDLIALLSAASAPEIENGLRQYVAAVAKFWQHETDRAIQKIEHDEMPVAASVPHESRREPAFMAGLPGDQLRQAFRNAAVRIGWMHPGLLLAGETLAAFGRRTSPVQTFTTWVMFALDHPADPHGVLAELTMERIPGGCGVLVPDACATGYFRMDAKFSDGLQHAWYAVRKWLGAWVDAGQQMYDVRWRLDLLDAAKDIPGRPIASSASGPSAEAAFACAMAALHPRKNEPLDRYSCITAKFQKPSFTESLDLEKVGLVEVKTLAGRLTKCRVKTVVVATEQGPHELKLAEPEFEFPKAADLPAAYELLARWPRMTRQVRERIHAESTALRIKLCGARPADTERDGEDYVRSPMRERLMEDGARGPVLPDPSSKDDEQRVRALDRNEIDDLLHGRWRPPAGAVSRAGAARRAGSAPRIRIFAHSGMGKSVLMLICEQTISEGPDGRLIPLRIGKTDGQSATLSVVDWQQNDAAVRDKLLGSFLKRHLDERDSGFAEKWFQRSLSNGEVVLLLDALDQTPDSVIGLGVCLHSEEFANCPVVIAGRPESFTSKREAWSANDWTTLELLPFTRAEQETYLGTVAAARLLPTEDTLDAWTDPDEKRRHGWKDLLEVPLLLSLLKMLAQPKPDGCPPELDGITNRSDLYQRAVEHLFEKGWQTLQDTRGKEKLTTCATACDVLGQIAWFAVQRHNFTGRLAGAEFAAVAREWGDLLSELKQIDIVTAHGLLDQVNQEALEWRHRSFLEFFAGRRLVEGRLDTRGRTTPAVPHEERQRALDDIHTVLDSTGAARVWDVVDESGNRRREFRDLRSDWEPTLRFALAHADPVVRDELACRLIARGNPWVVFESIDGDKLSCDRDVEQTVRWLVHRDWSWRRDFTKAWSNSEHKPEALTQLKEAVVRSLERPHRDSACIVPACELLDDWTFEELDRVDPADPAGLVTRLVPRFRGERERLTSAQQELLDTFLGRFVRLRDEDFDARRFHPEKELKQADWRARGIADPSHIPIRGIEMADFPVENQLFELFDPGHRRWRGGFRRDHEQPALYVNWYMANAFCAWLTANDPQGRKYRLPTEWEWEAACRWGTQTKFWWGDQDRGDLMNCGHQSRRTNTRDEALERFQAAGLWHPSRDEKLFAATNSEQGTGLLDLHGNVWEWCAGRYTAGSSGRVLRGGSWYDGAINCRSAYRSRFVPDGRDFGIGLRVVRFA